MTSLGRWVAIAGHVGRADDDVIGGAAREETVRDGANAIFVVVSESGAAAVTERRSEGPGLPH